MKMSIDILDAEGRTYRIEETEPGVFSFSYGGQEAGLPRTEITFFEEDAEAILFALKRVTGVKV